MKTLWVGDAHVKQEDFADCEALLDLVEETALAHKVDRIVLLGDQYHQFALVNVEVERFWMQRFARLKAYEVIALVGNHDRPGDRSSSAHAMQVHRDQVCVVDSPLARGNTLFLPYYHDQHGFLTAATAFRDCTTLVCHQTFSGAQYENGFYAKEALDPEQVPQQRIISGHIHKPSRFGKVWYPGSPRWQTISDANTSRAIWVEDEETGFPVDTGRLRCIWQLTDVEGEQGPTVAELLDQQTKAGDRIVINLQGGQAWCAKRKRDLEGLRPGIRFRAFHTDGRAMKVRESDGIATAFRKHVQAYQPKHGTSKDVLLKMVEERAHVG